MEIRLIYEPYKAFCRKMITREFEIEFEKPFCTNIILASEDCQLVRWEFQTNIRDFYRVEYHGKFRKKSVRICQDKNWEALEESFKKGTIEKDIEKLTIPYERQTSQNLT